MTEAGFMDWVDGLCGFHLDDDPALNNEVDSVFNFQLLAFVDNW